MTDTTLTVSAAPKLYTPNMVLVSTLLGGPLAGGALIFANYKAMGEHAAANRTLLWTLGILLFLTAISRLIPHIVLSAISWGIASVAQIMARHLQWQTKKPKASWWLAILICVAALIAYLVFLYSLNLMVAMFFPQLFH